MRAIQVKEYVKGPLDLTVSTLPTPTPSPTSYLIEIHSAGTNFFDLLQIQGKYQHQPPLPWVSGSEFSGTVLATPSGVANPKFPVGSRVFGASQGAYATHVAVPEASLLPIPEGWSFADAAGLYVTAPTSYAALTTRANVQVGEWVLVHAAAGGVGLAAVQFAKALGATVIATAGSERKRQVAKSFGADFTIDYTDAKWPEQVVAICKEHRTGNGKAGVDVVYDPVGMIEKSLKCVAWNARLLVIGFAAGSIEKVAINRVLLKNVSLVGLHWGPYARMEAPMVAKVWEGIYGLIEKGQFRGTIFSDDKFVGLESVPRALKALGGRETWGKVVVEVIEDESAPAKSRL